MLDPTPPTRPQILNVNDDDSTRYAVARILKLGGFDTWDVPTGQEGLELAKNHPDLIVLDVKLPDIDGFEVCRILKADPLTSTIPILHLSAKLTDQEDKITGLENGADGYLRLPLEQAELIATVGALLRMHNAEQDNIRLLGENRSFLARQWMFMRDVLSSVTDGKLILCATPDDLPHDGKRLGGDIVLDAASLMSFRLLVKQTAEAAGFDPDRWSDLIGAANEAATNALVHAGGGIAHLEGNDNHKKLQVWIQDQGLGIDMQDLPQATLKVGYTTAGTLGQGMKLMLKMVDHMWLLTNPHGTTIVLEQSVNGNSAH